jgi:hypothetical protein
MLNIETWHLYADPEHIVKATGCSLATARRWHKQNEQMPPAAKRLLSLYLNFEFDGVFGKAWKGYRIRQGLLCCEFWPDGITPEQLRKVFCFALETHNLKCEVACMRKVVLELTGRCEVLERDNRFFRDQMKQERLRVLLFRE